MELICAFLVDLTIGDPRWLPHPVRVIGSAITNLEQFLRRYAKLETERFAGVLLVAGIVLPVAGSTYFLQKFLHSFALKPLSIIGAVFIIYLISTTIAVRGLTDAARLVIRAVQDCNLEAARKDLSMIVGRDTANLSGERALAATIETLAENLSDGVIAPVFYLVVGGLPLAMAYKAINTLDSMVGYKNEKYIRFGWAAARLDDLANYIPARLTGLIIVAASFIYSLLKHGKGQLQTAISAWSIMQRDGRNHSSPNSGIPEAAMAGALGVRLGGPSTYDGSIVEKPYIGDNPANDYLIASRQAMVLVFVSSALAIATAAGILFVRSIP
ncbi:MAG: adenosylcobinamide-phosphate synthase CbiB [Nitrospiraceae bacterium]|nr:adenosylcobinamide-phosphate synthase CbiB [Nitrospiraceae bacterium]